MIMNFDKFERYDTPSMILCYPSSRFFNGAPTDTIGEIPFCSDNEFVFNFGDTSELNFRTKLVTTDSSLYKYNNYIYKQVQKKLYIFVPEIGYFRIEDVKETITEYESYKDVECVSCECEIAERFVPFFKDGSYLLIELLYGRQVPFYEGVGTSIPQWGLTAATMTDDIDGDLIPPAGESDLPYRRYISFVSDQNAYDFFLNTLQTTYGCVFSFDIINRKIKVYKTSNYINSAQTSVHLTRDDVVREIQINDSRNSVITALCGKTKNDDTFAAINPTGDSYIYDLSEYVEWLPSGLQQRVLTWMNNISTSEDSYYSNAITYAIQSRKIDEYDAEISRLETLRSVYQRCINNITNYENLSCVDVYNGELPYNDSSEMLVPASTVASTITVIQAQIDNVAAEIASQAAARASSVSSRSTAQSAMASIRANCDPKQFFTEFEMLLLNTYIYPAAYTVENLSSDDSLDLNDIDRLEILEELYNQTKYKLNEINKPIPDFSITTDNFIFVIRFQKWTNQLKTGAIINVETGNNSVSKLFITSMTVNYGDHSSGFTFSNALRNNNARYLFRDVFEGISEN